MNWGNGRVYTDCTEIWPGMERLVSQIASCSWITETIGSLQLRIDGNTYQARFEPARRQSGTTGIEPRALGFDLQPEIAAGEIRPHPAPRSSWSWLSGSAATQRQRFRSR
ncbi:MAG: hypothetical protein R3F53_05750 [Gammaproteobacteria bacterium]